jgi:hypothetical protein
MVPVLRRPVSSLIPLATFDALQHLSSLVGLFVVVIWFRRNAPRAMYPWTPSCDAAMAARRLVSWVVLAAAALGLGMFNGARRLRRPSGSLSRVVAAALVGAMAGVIGATLALAVASAALRTATRD